MPTFEQDILQIRGAVYGSEVREAIADGLEKCHGEVSAGSKAYEIVEYGLAVPLTNGYYIDTSGQQGTMVSAAVSDYIRCSSKASMYFRDTLTGVNALTYAFYTKDKTFISGLGNISGDFMTPTIPAGTYYVRFCSSINGHTPKFFIYDIGVIDEANVDAVTAADSLSKGVAVKWNMGKFIATDGTLTNDSNYAYTDLYPCNTQSSIFLNDVYAGATSLLYAFYDADKAFISGTGNASGDIEVTTIPATAKYVRFGTRNNGSNDPHAYIEYGAAVRERLDSLDTSIGELSDAINELHNLVDYNYHIPYFRAPDPSQNNSAKLGVQRDEMFVVLNGTLNYTNTSGAARVRLNGSVSTTNIAATAEGWTTNTVSLIAGHTYRGIVHMISGTATTVPAFGFCRSGESAYVGTGTRPDANSYVMELTAEANTTYNIVLSCAKGATFTDARLFVYLLDITAEMSGHNETTTRLNSSWNILEYGLKKKWSTDELTRGYWSNRAISSATTIVCIRSLYNVQPGETLRISNNTTGLWFAYAVYVTSGSEEASGWITGTEHTHTFTHAGQLWIQFCNAQASADRTDITPADITLDFGIMDQGYVVDTLQNVDKLIVSGNKTLAFLGDSITAGVGTNYIYHMYLGGRFGWTCKNYGYGGSGYARSYPSTGGKMATGQVGMGETITSSNKFEPNDFLTRIATIDTTIDALVIFGGTNDWAHGDEISVADFTTAVNNVFSYAQTNFGRIPIIVLLPIHRGSDSTPNSTTGKTLRDYCEIIKECAIPFGIRCIDLFAESGLNPANQHNNDLYYVRDDTGVSDSLHPNHYAHKVISNLIASALYDALY